MPIRIWDEARHAVNSQEMLENGNILVPHFRGKPEMWTTKPPLLIWLQAISLKCFLMNEFAVRLPSAVAGLFTCFLLMWFSKRHLGHYFVGYIACVILVTTQGYVGHHVTRTGDFDALLCLFTTASILFFYLALSNKSNRYLLLFFIALTLGVFTKSIAILIFSPVWILFAVSIKRFNWLVSNKKFYQYSLVFVLPVLAYYLGREAVNPGYLHAVYNNEITGRYLNTVENHNQPWFYYVRNIVLSRFSYWFIFLVPSIVFSFLWLKKRDNTLMLYLISCSIFYLVILSTAASKIEWYDAPTYPLFALILGLSLHQLAQKISRSKIRKLQVSPGIMAMVIVTLLALYPYHEMVSYVIRSEELSYEKPFYDIEYFIRDNETLISNLKNPRVVYDGYDVQIEFYTNALQSRGIPIHLSTISHITSGETIIANQPHVINKINETWEWTSQKVSPTVFIGVVRKK